MIVCNECGTLLMSTEDMGSPEILLRGKNHPKIIAMEAHLRVCDMSNHPASSGRNK